MASTPHTLPPTPSLPGACVDVHTASYHHSLLPRSIFADMHTPSESPYLLLPSNCCFLAGASSPLEDGPLPCHCTCAHPLAPNPLVTPTPLDPSSFLQRCTPPLASSRPPPSTDACTLLKAPSIPDPSCLPPTPPRPCHILAPLSWPAHALHWSPPLPPARHPLTATLTPTHWHRLPLALDHRAMEEATPENP